MLAAGGGVGRLLAEPGGQAATSASLPRGNRPCSPRAARLFFQLPNWALM
jgi:hypothetical protein